MILNLESSRMLFLSGLIAAVTVPACATSQAGEGKVTVVASFYPIAAAAERVGGDRVSVTNLTAPGVEPHDLELTPRQLADIADADVVLYLGGGFQPAVEDALTDARGDVVDVGADAERLPAADAQTGPTRDPHIWLDPLSYRRIVDMVRNALAGADRSGTSTLNANARAYDDDLLALDREYRDGLADCERRVFVTAHAAFAYLAARYDLTEEAISGISPDAEPPPQRIAAIRDFVIRNHVTTVFTEELVSPEVADTIARETGATTEVLNPLESLTPAEVSAGEDYVSVMRSNLSELEAALGCR